MGSDKPENLEYPIAYVYRPPEGGDSYQVALDQEKERNQLVSHLGINKLIEICITRKVDPDTITFVTKEQVKLLNLTGEDNVYPFPDEDRIKLLKKLREALSQSAE